MRVDVQRASRIASMKTGKLPDTSKETIDDYLKGLRAHQLKWLKTYPISKKIELLQATLANVAKYQGEWIEQDLLARHIPEGHWSTQESAMQPFFMMGYIQELINIMKEIEAHGGKTPLVKAHQDGNRVVIESFPRNKEEELRMPGFRGEIHLLEGTSVDKLPSYQALRYKDELFHGATALVLGAGNASMLSPADILHKLFVEKEVVIYKSNPVLEYLGDLLDKIFEPFIKAGFLRIAIGGAKEGQYLTAHPLVDNIHMTGSDKTFEAIVFGPGEEGKKNKELGKKLNQKPVSAELGNVSPVIVIPGDWEESDFDNQATNLLNMLSPLMGYACLAMRVLILPKGWNGNEKLVNKLAEKMSQRAPGVNYYPGTNQTLNDAMSCYPQADVFGKLDYNKQSWVFVKGLDSGKDEIAFNREFWATFTSQTMIEGSTKEEYLANAVKFANERLWGTLSSAIIVDPKSQKELEEKGALQKAIHDLRYGTVAINTGSGTTFGVNGPWGGYPGSTYTNIQSGNCFTSNRFMLDKIEKGVVYAPFRMG